MLFIAFLLSFSTNLLAQEKIYSLADFPKKEKWYFDMVGKEYIAKRDNEYLIEEHGISDVDLFSYKPFLKTPSMYSCYTTEKCERKRIYSNQKFVIENIVSPSDNETNDGLHQEPQYSCSQTVAFCYYKLKFDDGDIAYLSVIGLQEMENFGNAVLRKHLGFEQIVPVVHDAEWKKSKSFATKEFKKIGAKLGFTKEDVLMTAWGAPRSKTHTSYKNLDVDVWFYEGGMLTFTDEYLTQITTTR